MTAGATGRKFARGTQVETVRDVQVDVIVKVAVVAVDFRGKMLSRNRGSCCIIGFCCSWSSDSDMITSPGDK